MKIKKIKNVEELSIKYGTCDNIQLGIDDTDHIVFICNDCKKPLEVVEVISRYSPIHKDNCTWIYAVCNNCKTFGKRKFYWKTEDGIYCHNRTKGGASS